MSAVGMSSGMYCSICGRAITRMQDAQKVRSKNKNETAIRCVNYEACMVQAARRRRIEIGAEEPGDARR